MVHPLRLFIRAILAEAHDDSAPVRKGEKNDEELLLEPDTPTDPAQNEFNAISTGAIAGVTTPLGTDASYPAGRKKKSKRRALKGDVNWYKN